MAKQTFTTGQVLTAAQMTSLQETAMGGGPATAKTASYVLVAADAGTTVAMNAAGATTITVNTGLFAAGDTVFIQNLGAGACTVTAGTATVATAGSLILPQNDAGILYFTATGAAIFYDYIQAGAVSPLTTKGDLYTFGTSDTRLGVGANNTVLTSDSAEATGLKWATPSSGGMTLISTTTLSGASTSVSSIPATYVNLYVIIRNFDPSTDAASLSMKFNAHTTYDFQANSATANFASGAIAVTGAQDNGTSNALTTILISNYAGTTWKMAECMTVGNNSTTPANYQFERIIGFANLTSAIDTLVFTCSSGNFSGGTVLLYGVK